MQNAIAKIIVAIITFGGVIFMLAGLGLLMAFPIMWTWDATMPHIFGLPTITWGQAWCLNFLCGYLIKSSTTINKS